MVTAFLELASELIGERGTNTSRGGPMAGSCQKSGSTISGGMNGIVPMALPGFVSGCGLPLPVAMPKSTSCTVSGADGPAKKSARTTMFSGFTSRWTMPRACACASAAATWRRSHRR